MTSFLSNPSSVSPVVSSPSPLSPLQTFRRKASVGSSKFLHNERVILAFLPCLLVLSAYGGRWVIGTIVIGTLATYIADVLGSSAGCLVCIWTTLAGTELTLVEASVALIKESYINVAFLCNVVLFIALVGVWFCLNLDLAIVDLNPTILGTMERVLFACFPFPSVVLLTWATIALLGIEYAPAYLCIYLSVYYLTFGLPTPASWPHTTKEVLTMESGFLTSSNPPSSSSSSFPSPPSSSSALNPIARPPICGRVDNAAQTILYALLPALFHVCIYHRVLFFNWDQLAMLGLLLAVPSLVIASRPNSLWWFDSPSSSNRLPLSQRIRRLIFLVAGAILLGCLEYRVIFFSFHHFIAAYPPWSYIFVTLAIYSLAYFVVAHFTSGFGIISKPISEGISTRDKNISLGAAMIGAGAIGLTLGTPLYFMPFPVLNAYFFVNFYYHKKFSDYLGFLITVTIFLVWFMRKTFWFLDYQFGEGGDTISLQTTAILLVSIFVFSFLVIGVAIVNQNQNLVGLLLFIHSLGVSALEHVMYVHQHEHDEVAYSAASFLPKDIVYPGYFVIFTSLVGTFLACRLESEKKISNTFAWLTASIYLSKFALLLAPLRFSHLAAFSLVASISPLYYFYRAPTMKRQLALTHAVVIGIAAFFTRRIIPARIAEMFTGEQPSESQALAFFFIIWGIGCLPLSLTYFINQRIVRSVNLLVIAAGLLFALLRPDTGYGLFSDLANHHHLGPLNLSRAAPWLLIAVVLLSLASFTSLLPLRKSENVRMIYSVVSGACLGLFFAGTYLPFSLFLYSCYTVLFTLLVTFLVFVQFPTQRSGNFTAWLYIIIIGMFFLLWSGINNSFKDATINPRKKVELLTNSRIVSISIYAAVNFVIAVFLKFKTLEFSPPSSSSVPSSSSSSGVRVRPASVASASVSSSSADPSVEEWVPIVGNIATIIALVLGVGLNIFYLNGSVTCIFVLAPLLLLLNKDRFLFHQLGERNRYFPVILATTLFLMVASVFEIWIVQMVPGLRTGTTAHLPTFTIWGALKNTTLLALTLPSHYYFSLYIWNLRKQDEVKWLVILSFNIFPLFFANVTAITTLSIVGVLGGLFAFKTARQIQKEGLKAL